MRTAHTLLVSKGIAKSVASGSYDEAKSAASSAIEKLKAGESVWLVSSGQFPKIFKGPKSAPESKKESTK